MKLFKNGKFYRKQYFMDTITNFRYGGITLKTIFFGQNTKKMANSDIMCITQKVIFIDKTLLKRQILDMGGITQKTIFYGENTLKMANSRYGGKNQKVIFIDKTL